MIRAGTVRLQVAVLEEEHPTDSLEFKGRQHRYGQKIILPA
jgi:hypothetical protein